MARLLQYMFFSCVAFALPCLFSGLYAQDRCGTVEYSKMLHPNDPLHKINFERWMSDRMLRSRSSRQGRQQTASYKIPVVVHVIHNGEALGVGANIPDDQILSQIRVLNEDFARLNADTVNTPAEFAAVAGSLNVEFVLAKRDPEGFATNGIVRVNGQHASWTLADNYELKSLSYWPAEEYMNIWVCNLGDNYAGYSQFPESSLPGMENSSSNRLTDGVVIWHKAFGSIDDGAFNLDPYWNKGRTATHEIGHFLGLNHIWGDEPLCAGSDYVDDTPNQGDSTNGCPSHPRSDACSEVIMFQNYLDYTDDDCMNLFTEGQVARMVTVLENSPRRNSLVNSPGLQDPLPFPNDLGIKNILSPDASVCSNLVTPTIEVRNYGNNTITSARVRFVVDGSVKETADFALSLDPLDAQELAFTPLSMPSGNHSITFQILETNGGSDGGSYNDVTTSAIIVPFFGSAPFTENFTTPPVGWITSNPDGQITWGIATAPKDAPTNKALKLNLFDYEDKLGEVDAYISPVMDLSSAPTATLSFDVAYARYQVSDDRLKVIVLANCESTADGTVVYSKAGDSLKTAPSTTSPFTPANAGQWRRELIDLSPFAGMSNVQVAFVGINDWGNNIYLDNISLFTDQTWDVALSQLLTPSVVSCEEELAPTVLIRNEGSVALASAVIDYSINNGPIQSSTINLDLPIAGEQEITLPLVHFAQGVNHLFIDLRNPNGFTDHDDTNDENTYTLFVNQSEDRIPLRQNFENGLSPAWTTVNPTGDFNWRPVMTNFGTSLYFNAYDDPVVGDEAWFVTPVLDFSGVTEASMMFDLSYVAGDSGSETLTLLASTDCGVSYDELKYTLPSDAKSSSSWLPQGESDWTRNVYINLNEVAGKPEARIAFVVRNGHGNNLYLDNIEFFDSANPSAIDVDTPYAVYGYDLTDPALSNLRITFNLPERQNVRFSLINAAGQMETDGMLTDVLNQTYPLGVQRLPPGVYFVRVLIGKRFYTSRVMISR
jgi:hypothetical protein